MSTHKIAIKRALVSVYDKTGLEELVSQLHAAGVELVSTGGSAALIASLGIPVTAVEDVTGFPECLGGRVKTLHPKIHAGILADQRNDSHVAELSQLEVAAFELVISNLYPFSDTVASGAGVDECLEQIDIGGPSMVRAAAKNHPSVAIVTSPSRYDELIEAVRNGGFSLQQRQQLAAEAFAHTAAYDAAVATWMGQKLAPLETATSTEAEAETAVLFPSFLGQSWQQQAVLRYGENPHQAATLYQSMTQTGLAQAQQLHGKDMSYNNYVDADAAHRAAYDFDEPAAAVIKHANPCGIAIGPDIETAYQKAHATDPVSAFGGVIATNRPVSVAMAKAVGEVFTEVIVAPGYEDGAVEVLAQKKNLRILVASAPPRNAWDTRAISGGLLVQQRDQIAALGDDPETWELVAGEPASAAVLADLAFAWRACRSVKSNAILLAQDGAAVGVGMGQVNRVDSCKLAVERAGARVKGAVAASDAFFPFEDGPQVLINAGVVAIVQPGGSIRDDRTIAACREAGITMYFTGTRHFFH